MGNLPASARGARERRILLVEDDRSFARDLIGTWNPSGSIRWAASGSEALEFTRTDVPDLILLDLCLPRALADVDENEGFRLIEHFRRDRGWNMPIIVVTHDSSRQTAIHALALGGSAVLVKPIDLAELDQLVERLLGTGTGFGRREDSRDTPPGGADGGAWRRAPEGPFFAPGLPGPFGSPQVLPDVVE
jgi:two-component system, NarL family, sensor histidine kinase BarA